MSDISPVDPDEHEGVLIDPIPPGATLEQLVEHLTNNVAKLAVNVQTSKKTIKDLGAVQTSQKTTNRRLVKALAVLAVVLAVAVGAAISSYSTAKQSKRTALETQRVNKASQDRAKIGLIGICAVVNVNRIGNQNMLADINANKPYVQTATWPAFFEEWYPYWQPLDCRASLSEKDKAQICLQYPPINDPKTGLPSPTTTDPYNATACAEQNAEE